MNVTSTILDVLVGAAALAVALTVGRDNIKKRTIAELKDLVEALEKKIDGLQKTVSKLLNENTELKETIDGYSDLVREGHLVGSSRARSRNHSTTSQTP